MRKWGTIAAALPLCFIATAHAEISDGVVKIGVLEDESSVYSDSTGAGAILAVQMAIDDFGGKVAGAPIVMIHADQQNKPDIGAAIAREWLDREKIDVFADVQTTSVALAVAELARQAKKPIFFTSAGSSDLTGKYCTPFSIHWTFDTYALANVAARALVQQGNKSWFFITADYAFGTALERDASNVVKSLGGSVLGDVRVPLNTSDFSSAVLQAQGSGAQIVALANAGGDAINAIKQAAEFGVTPKQKIAGLQTSINEIDSLGLATAKGLLVTEAFYWDLDEPSRTWSKRFIEKRGKMPSMFQAGIYGAVTHYLKAVAATGSDDGPTVMAKMKEMPVNDFMTRDGKIREDGRLLRDMYLFQVKDPAESHYKFDDYKLLATVSGDKAYRPLAESECPLIKK